MEHSDYPSYPPAPFSPDADATKILENEVKLMKAELEKFNKQNGTVARLMKELEAVKKEKKVMNQSLEVQKEKLKALEFINYDFKSKNETLQKENNNLKGSVNKLQLENAEFRKNRWSEHEVSQLKNIHQDEMKNLQKQLHCSETFMPDRGTNNTEDVEMEKFVKFVLLIAEKLGKLAEEKS